MGIYELVNESPLSFSLFLASALLSWSAGIVIYRIYFHPLSKFPGPKLAIATYSYEFYYEAIKGGRYTWKLEELHKIYGPIIRLNPDELHIDDPDYFDEIYCMSKRVDKPLTAAETFGPLPSSFGTVKHDQHRVRRAALNPHFSKKSVSELYPWIVSRIEKLSGRFEDAVESGGIVNLKYAYAALSLDIIYEYCFSRTLDSLAMEDFNKGYVDLLEEAFHMTPIFFELHWLGVIFFSLPGWLVRIIHPRFSQLLDEREKVSNQIEAIRSGTDKTHEASHHPTVLHSLLNSDLPPLEKARPRIRDEAQTLIGAGTTTVALALLTTTLNLLTNPTPHARLLHELRTTLPSPHTLPPLQTLEHLPYLTACILEGLRLADNSTHRLLRSFPSTSLVYRGMSIPVGTVVSMTPIHLHHNASIFPHPSEFKPERWFLPGDETQINNSLKRYLVPFGKGPRACLGMNLAMAELYLAIAAVFRRFDFELHDVIKERDWMVSRDNFNGSVSAESTGVMVGVMHVE